MTAMSKYINITVENTNAFLVLCGRFLLLWLFCIISEDKPYIVWYTSVTSSCIIADFYGKMLLERCVSNFRNCS